MDSLFPLHKEWNDESREKMDDIMELLKDNFIWESGDEDPKNPGFKMTVILIFVHRWCTLTVQSAVRSWKAKIKKKYYKEWKDASPQQRDQINFERITRREWEDFVNYIDNPNKEDEAARNLQNFLKKKLRHCLGQKSMARTKRKLKELDPKNYDEFDIFIKCHKKKMGLGDYPHNKTQDVCEKVIKRIEELRVQLQDVDPLTKAHQLKLSTIIDEVAEKHHEGYERGYGIGYKGRTMIHPFSTSYNVESSINNSQLKEELDVANQKIQELYAANKKIQELHEEIQKRAEEAEREKAREKEERDYQIQEMQRIVSSFQAMAGLNRQPQ
ncbi:uncharacterized protein A4U43_C04F17870 [Asparagus officinalis]|uniref:Uncharacterized protein n=1 Tax=Asparagus officinalis TaxID=4686 RepID=A0A5P1F4E9_ASPOF|nr:uncharacterized protein A4U43_C04F17870 [Asparagus officinalis]